MKTTMKDQHAPDTVQMKAWVTRQMKADFFEACKAADISPSAELRRLLLAYIMAFKTAQKNGQANISR